MVGIGRKVLCLDWDKRSLRIVVARVGRGRTVLEDAHSHRLPGTVDADDPELMGEFIRSMLRRHRLRFKSVVVDVPRERAVMNRLSLPPTPTSEVAAAVRFQAMKELPFPLDSAAVDYVIMGRDEEGLATEVLLAAVTIETLDRVRLTCEAAGLTPTRIGLRPYANVISTGHMRQTAERHVLFVDVGPGATEIDVMHGDALLFARSANVNVPLPTVDVDSRDGSRDESRIIHITEIGDLDGTDEAVAAAVGELLVETTRTLQAYRVTEPDAVVDEVIVAGGTGIENQLSNRLSQRLSLPVRLFDATESLGVNAAESPKLRSFSAALGLAWGVAREGTLALDFLNPKRPVSRGEITRRRVRIGVLAASIVVIAAVGVIGREYKSRASRRDALVEANRNLTKKVLEKREILNRIEEAEEWAVEAIWPEELLNITELAMGPGSQSGEKMVVQEITLDTVSRNPGILLRNVFASDWQVPTDFVKRLNALESLDGEPLYEASQAAWSEIRDAQKYHGKVDIRVQLRRLLEFREQAPERAKARKQRLKNLGR